MAQVVGVHEITLGDGADPAEFEALAKAMQAQEGPPGMNLRVFKCDRGPRTGQYLLLMEIDSVERRDEFFPVEDEDSARFLEWLAAHPASAEALGALRGFEPSTDVTNDYAEITP